MLRWIVIVKYCPARDPDSGTPGPEGPTGGTGRRFGTRVRRPWVGSCGDQALAPAMNARASRAASGAARCGVGMASSAR